MATHGYRELVARQLGIERCELFGVTRRDFQDTDETVLRRRIPSRHPNNRRADLTAIRGTRRTCWRTSTSWRRVRDAIEESCLHGLPTAYFQKSYWMRKSAWSLLSVPLRLYAPRNRMRPSCNCRPNSQSV